MTWLNELIEQHSELESPKSFWYWSGLCAISAVVKDNVWLDCGGAWPLYPNIYVMLYADSGLRKGAPIALVKNLVKRVNNTRVISGRSSIQGILRKLSTSQTAPGQKIMNRSCGFIVSSEFSSSLVNDPAAMTILTDLYDRHWNEEEWESLLKMEEFKLKDPTISLLTGINEAHFDDFIEAKDVHGGFIGRTFLIAESKVSRLNPLMAPLRHKPDKEKLAEYLKKLSTVTGEFEPTGTLEESGKYPIERITEDGSKWFNEVGVLYHDWYMTLYGTIEAHRIEDKTGTIQRIGDSVKKVAMLLSLSAEPNLIISLLQMQEAIIVCEKLIGNVRKTTHGKKGMSPNKNQKALIINELLDRGTHKVTRAILLKKYWMNFDADSLDQIMVGFDAAGIIKMRSEGNQVVYEMPERQVQEIRDFLAGKN
jgi:hypothetical protein